MSPSKCQQYQLFHESHCILLRSKHVEPLVSTPIFFKWHYLIVTPSRQLLEFSPFHWWNASDQQHIYLSLQLNGLWRARGGLGETLPKRQTTYPLSPPLTSTSSSPPGDVTLIRIHIRFFYFYMPRFSPPLPPPPPLATDPLQGPRLRAPHAPAVPASSLLSAAVVGEHVRQHSRGGGQGSPFN